MTAISDDRVQLDALVVQDAGHRATQHAEERHRPAPLPARAGAAEDRDAVGEAADQRGAVVEPQQVAEDLGVVAVPVLHLPQVLRLLVDDGLHAAGDVDEGALCGVAQVLLRGHRLQHGPQHLAVRGLEVRVAPGLVGGHRGEDVVGELTFLQSGHRVGQQDLGQAYRLGVLLGQAVLESDVLLRVPGTQLFQGATAPAGYRRDQADRDRRHNTAPGNGCSGSCGHDRHGNSRAHGDRRRRQHPREARGRP